MLSILFSVLSLTVAAADPACEKLSPLVQKQFGLACSGQIFALDGEEPPTDAPKENPRFSILVMLNKQADLGLKEMYRDPVARRVYVVEALRDTALRSQAALHQLLVDGSYHFTPYFIYNMIFVSDADAALVERLAKRAEVAKIYGNPSFKVSTPGKGGFATLTEDPAARAIEANIESIGAPRVWNELGVKGKGIVVAGQDTGVQWEHPALVKQYRGSAPNGRTVHDFSWHDAIKANAGYNKCGASSPVPCDDDKHGTHTVGTIVGNDGADNQIGVAPESKWVACRNMDAGNGTPWTYIDCFQFFLAPYPVEGNAFTDGDPTKAPHVMNNSWGCPSSEGCQGDEMERILKNMKDAGIFVVASAGNEGPDCTTIESQPASISEYTFSVGAHNHRNNEIAYFSSRGPSKLDQKVGPDLTAPGVGIRSSVPGGYEGTFWSGTSMAGPHVVGVVALMWSANSKLIGEVDATSAILRATATPTTSTETCGGIPGSRVPNNTFGYGRVNAYEAVKTAISFGK